MDKKFKRAICTIFMLCIISLAGCTNKEIKIYDANIAAIQTSTNNNISYLKLYNFNGEYLGEKRIKVPDINSGFIHPIISSCKAYMNSLGGYTNHSNKVVEVNLNENNYKTYEIAYGIWSITANDEYIFTSHSPVGSSIISKYNKKTISIEDTLQLQGQVTHINLLNDLLYVFSTIVPPDKKTFSLEVSIINLKTFRVVKNIKVNGDIYVWDSMFMGSNMFFTTGTKNDDSTPSTSLYKLNLNNYEITSINLNKDFPWQVKQYNGTILISQFDPMSKKGNVLSVVDVNSKNIKYMPFKHNLNQMEIYKDKLYIFDDNNLYIYDPTTFKLYNKIEIKCTKNDYRNQGFFIIK